MAAKLSAPMIAALNVIGRTGTSDGIKPNTLTAIETRGLVWQDDNGTWFLSSDAHSLGDVIELDAVLADGKRQAEISIEETSAQAAAIDGLSDAFAELFEAIDAAEFIDAQTADNPTREEVIGAYLVELPEAPGTEEVPPVTDEELSALLKPMSEEERAMNGWRVVVQHTEVSVGWTVYDFRQTPGVLRGVSEDGKYLMVETTGGNLYRCAPKLISAKVARTFGVCEGCGWSVPMLDNGTAQRHASLMRSLGRGLRIRANILNHPVERSQCPGVGRKVHHLV